MTMRIRRLLASDIAFGQQLRTENHWNQLDADWQRQLYLESEGCFLAEVDGQPVATACACIFGDVGWISMVFVDRLHRGRGIGTAMLRHVLRYLDERGTESIRLDATPLGQPLYEKLGFVGEITLSRFAGVMPTLSDAVPSIEPLAEGDLPAVFELDESVTQTRREKLLRHLYEAHPDNWREYTVGGRLDGYCFARPGANAWQIGPIQGSPEAGRRLLLNAARRFAGRPVYLDLPTDHAEAVALAQSLGLTEQRKFLRMGRGRRVTENLAMFWSSFGPEKG
jgi:GNAT superfamily N-acetyltransferase